jgi:hypothetical protein
MARYGVVVLSIVVMAAAAVLAGTCGMQGGGTPQVGKMRHYSKSVDPKDAQPARAKLKMGAGQLKLASDPSGAALSTPQRHGGTPQASKRGD